MTNRLFLPPTITCVSNISQSHCLPNGSAGEKVSGTRPAKEAEHIEFSKPDTLNIAPAPANGSTSAPE